MLPLSNAIEDMDVVRIRALLDAGADPNFADPDLGGFCPLHLSVDVECEDSCRRYDAGDLNAMPQATITRILVAAGANPDIPDVAGNTARSIAKERAHAKALALFVHET